MPWPLRLIDKKELSEKEEHPQTGDCWFADYLLNDEDYARYFDRVVSPEYLRDWAGKRSPILICLPGGIHWNIDSKGGGSDSGWIVAGECPNLTITPSISVGGLYHGYVTDGVLTDDIEGRHYDENGKLIG